MAEMKDTKGVVLAVGQYVKGTGRTTLREHEGVIQDLEADKFESGEGGRSVVVSIPTLDVRDRANPKAEIASELMRADTVTVLG